MIDSAFCPITYNNPPDRLAWRVTYIPLTEKISRNYLFDNHSFRPRLFPEIEEWVMKNSKPNFGACHLPLRMRVDPQYDWSLWFEHEKDAIMFKVRWW
jgi:hypothetical protein